VQVGVHTLLSVASKNGIWMIVYIEYLVIPKSAE
jgi:hypothetical protein